MNSQKLQRHYKHKVSGFKEWDQLAHSEEYLIYPENMTDKLSIDEVSLSKGELYTFVTNKNTKVKNKKSVVAVIGGTEAKTIQEVLEKIPLEKRKQVKEVIVEVIVNKVSIDKLMNFLTKIEEGNSLVKVQKLKIQTRFDDSTILYSTFSVATYQSKNS